MDLYIIRHGQTELNSRQVLQGRSDYPLNEAGIAQAQAAAEDYCRAAWTAEEAPETVRLAVLLMASHFYEYRDSSDRNAYNTMMHAFHALLYPNRAVDSMF